MKRAIAMILTVSVLLCVGSGTIAWAEEATDTLASFGITIEDMAGNTITLAKYPNSIFCETSMFEQLVLALGAEPLLRASSYARLDDARSVWMQTLYPQVLDLEPAGGDQNGITNEMLVDYELDLMIVGSQDKYDELTAIGIPCVVLDIRSLEDLTDGLTILGQCLGGEYQSKSETMVVYCSAILADVESRTVQIADTDRITAYFMESRYAASNPTLYMTWGKDAFQSNCLRLAGINTVADDILEGRSRAEITTEQLILSDPDVIIIGGFYEQMNYDALVQDDSLKILSAVQNDRIYRAPVGTTEWTRIGMESFLLPLWYGVTFYPNLYADIDISATVCDFYQKVMGVELTEDYLVQILSGAEGPEK